MSRGTGGEKILAAARFGLKRVILPRHNEADLDDVPDPVREELEFVLVDTVDEVLAATLSATGEDHGVHNGRRETEEVSDVVVAA